MAKDSFVPHGVVQSTHIKGDSEATLHFACQLIFDGSRDKTVVAYKEIYVAAEEGPGIVLVLYWQPVSDAVSIPEPITKGHDVHGFLRRWYFQQDQNKFQWEYPEGDGAHGLGYEIYTGWENTGLSSEFNLDPWPVLMVFKPIHIYYGK